MSETIYKQIAEEANGAKIIRADLAVELKVTDSIEVSRLAWEAYNHYGKDQQIKSTFVNNDSQTSIVDEYELRHLITADNKDGYFDALSTDLKNGENALTVSTIC